MSPAQDGRPDRVLELRGIGRQFGTDPPVHALVNVDLSLYRGDWLTITGPSGAGKSTLLNIIGCLDSPTSGRYFIDGIDMPTGTVLVRARRHAAGTVRPHSSLSRGQKYPSRCLRPFSHCILVPQAAYAGRAEAASATR